MPEGTPYIPTLQNPTAGTDPKALERAILNALEKKGEPDTQAVPMRHWTQALAGVANTGVDQFQARAAAAQLAQQRANAAGAYPSLEGDDSTSGGNNNNTASNKFDDTNLDPHARTTIRLESSGDPNAVTGKNRGLFQFGPPEEARYGLNDKNWNDPNASYEAFQKERKDHETLLRAKGIDPTPDTLYLAHQQGAGGAISHLKNPNQPAWMSMYQTAEGQQKGEKWARQAIIDNPVMRNMDPNISSGDFVKALQKKYNDIYSGYTKAPVGGPSSPQAVLAPGGQGMEPSGPPGSPTPLGRALAFAPQVAQNSAPAGTNPPVRSQLQDRLDQAPKDIWDPKMYSGPNPALNRDVQQRAQQMRGTMGVAAPESVPLPQPRPPGAPPGALPYTADDKPPGAVNVAQATPQGQPQGAPQADNGLPKFIPPTQRVPQGLDGQIRRLLSDPDPTVRARGDALWKEWNDKANSFGQYTTPNGLVYEGNIYRGWKLSQLPAKPTIEKFQYDVGGVKGEDPKQLTYDNQGRPIYRTIPTEGTGGPTKGIESSDPFPANGSVQDKQAWADRHSLRMKEQEAYAGKQGEVYSTKAGNIEKVAAAAQDELPQLQLLQNVISNPKFKSGTGADFMSRLSSAAQQLGLGKGEIATLLQFAKKAGAAGSLENVQEMAQSGAVRIPEMQMIQQSNFDVTNTPEANRAVVDTRIRLAQRRMQVAEFAQNYMDTGNIEGKQGKGTGRIDRGFDQQVRAYYKAKPLFSDAEIKNYRDLFAEGGGKGQPVQGTSAAPTFPGAPQVGTVVKGHEYLGGNPNDEKSWKKATQ